MTYKKAKSLDNFNNCIEHSLFKIILPNGKSNNDKGRKHTLNHAINIMAMNKMYSFDINVINNLINKGAIVSNNDKYNTLTIAIKYAVSYLKNETNNTQLQTKKEKDMILLIHTLINAGAIPSNAQNLSNSLSVMFQSKNLNLIKFIVEIHQSSLLIFLPNNYLSNTMTVAVKSENLDIVKIANDKFGAIPDNSNSANNTLITAIKTNNSKIIKEIILLGGRYDGLLDELFFWKDEILINKIDLLLSQNVHFSSRFFSKINNDERFNQESNEFNEQLSLFNLKLLSYLKISKKRVLLENKTLKIIAQKIKNTTPELRKTLQRVTNDLIREYENRHLKNCDLENILICMPSCCTNIIHSYQYIPPPFKIFIWKN